MMTFTLSTKLFPFFSRIYVNDEGVDLLIKLNKPFIDFSHISLIHCHEKKLSLFFIFANTDTQHTALLTYRASLLTFCSLAPKLLADTRKSYKTNILVTVREQSQGQRTQATSG